MRGRTQSVPKLELHYGNAVRGAQRFARPALEASFLDTLERSDGIKMFGLRRIGKSTLVRFALEHLAENGVPHVDINGQGMTSLGDLLSKLAKALPPQRGLIDRALGLLADGPGHAALAALTKDQAYEDAALSAYWRLISDALLRALAVDGAKPVLVFDEFSYFIKNMVERGDAAGRDDADKLLASMREWRGAGMKMLLTGSIGLTGLARRHGLDIEHFNDLQPFDVPELTQAEARDFIAQATSSDRWSEAHTEAFLRETNVLYPCFLVRGLLDVTARDPGPPEAFRDIFAEKVRPVLHNAFYNQFDKRFGLYKHLPNDEQRQLVLPVLATVMTSPDACPHDALPCKAPFTQLDLQQALTILVEDGFIHFREDAEGERSWRPASRLAAIWWKQAKLA